MEKTLEHNVICQFRMFQKDDPDYRSGGFTQTYEVTVGGSEPVGDAVDKQIAEIFETEMLATTKEYCGWKCLKESECDSFAFGDSAGEVCCPAFLIKLDVDFCRKSAVSTR